MPCQPDSGSARADMPTRLLRERSVLLVAVIFLDTLMVVAPTVNASTTITIQPSSIDSYVDAGNPNKNFGTQNWIRVDGTIGHVKRGLLTFDLSKIPQGQIIVTASLLLYMSTPPLTSRGFEVHRVTSNWTETSVNWNNQPSFVSTLTATNNTRAQPSWLTWNVTSDVSAGYSSPASWSGFLIKDSTELGSGGGLMALLNSRENPNTTFRPKLLVTYALQIPEMPLWLALILAVSGVGLLRRFKGKGTRQLDTFRTKISVNK